MITSMRGCVAYNDLWPWPISSRSFGLGLENRVRSVASTVPDGFFPYLVQMVIGMRRCVACDDLWPWPISSRSSDLDFENRVCSVTFSVLHRLFPYLPQIITAIRRCAVCESYNKIIKYQFFAIFSNSSAFALKKIYTSAYILSVLAQIITSIRGCVACNDLWPWPIFSRSFGLDLENCVRSVVSTVLDGFFPYMVQWSQAWNGVSHVMTFDLDLHLQGHSTLLWLGIQHDSIVWVIMRRRGYPQNAGVLVVLVSNSTIFISTY